MKDDDDDDGMRYVILVALFQNMPITVAAQSKV
jgi:hypothetical protein